MIKELMELKENYGDLPVYIPFDNMGDNFTEARMLDHNKSPKDRHHAHIDEDCVIIYMHEDKYWL